MRTQAGDLVSASEDFREAARRDPQDPTALENAARAAYALGRKREVAQTYEGVVRLETDPAERARLEAMLRELAGP